MKQVTKVQLINNYESDNSDNSDKYLSKNGMLSNIQDSQYVEEDGKQYESHRNSRDIRVDTTNFEDIENLINNNTETDYTTYNNAYKNHAFMKPQNSIVNKKQNLNKPQPFPNDNILDNYKDLKLIQTKAKVNVSFQVTQSPKHREKTVKIKDLSKLRVSLTQSLISVRKSMHVGLFLVKLELIMKSIFKKRMMLGYYFHSVSSAPNT